MKITSHTTLHVIQYCLLTALFVSMNIANAQQERRVNNHELHAEKHGRILDKETGAGIANAKIIATWNSSYENFHHSANGCVLQKIVTTDTQGYFVIPNVSKELDTSGRGTHGQFSPMAIHYQHLDFNWRLTVFKPGYVRPGDIEALKELDPRMIQFQWTNQLPDVNNTRSVIQVTPIKMQHAELSVQKEILYYAAILATGCGVSNDDHGKSLLALHQTALREIEPKLCNPPLEYFFNDIELNGLGRMTAPSESEFFSHLKASNPDYRSTNDGTPHLATSKVCESLHAVRSTQ